MQELFKTQAQQRPVFLFDGKVPAEIEDGDLADLAANAFATHQAKGEIALAGDLVVGSGLTDEPCLSGCYPHFEAATMIPFTRIKFGVSWRSHTSCNAEQGAERVKRVEPAVESKRKFIEVGL